MARNCFWSVTRFDHWTLIISLFLVDLFFIVDVIEVGSYLDDNTTYICGKDIEEVIQYLEDASKILFK